MLLRRAQVTLFGEPAWISTADDEGLATEMRENATEVGVKFFAVERATILGREDRVQEDLCERLRHGVSVGGPPA